jgi:hypothetical protein
MMTIAALFLLLWQISHIIILSDTIISWKTTTSTQPIDYELSGSMIKKKKRKRILIIAAVPRDERHIFTLWSELECLTSNVDHVLLSAPTWSQKILTKVVEEVKFNIPRFINKDVTIDITYHTNDRYDVGLWCDAIQFLSSQNQTNEYDEYGLLNDSVFALHEFPDLFDVLQSRNISLSSLSYSYSAKYFRSYGPEHFWVESVFRGLSQQGLATFMNHSCVPADHPYFCRELSISEQKACIINNFEHDLAKAFPRDKVEGIYESDAPNTTKIPPYRSKMTWANNPLYWKQLVIESNFPVAKENVKECISDMNSPLLQQCTKYISEQKVWDWDLDWWNVQDNSMPL